ncbi:hypothetical protein AMATHDRAFT_135184 [Amanita thiersii Skay4041]|uniref:rRNA biogenesis protein RRP36 n=1 Tax=Amanita thiersii Skay4041 TaxID=703135 RepID=A0A2A9P190_9AGAR|nr:hypothetical protein AMATHDRAFT_135184 [Amanita thiersii Skay4041]
MSTETENEDEDEEDADAPRVAQWVDSDELEELEESEGESEGDIEPMGVVYLSSLPFGTLRKAQYALTQAEVESDSDSDEESDDSQATEEHVPKKVEKVEWSLKPKSDIPKRRNKHAPVETTSKKPVTRRRTVIETKRQQPRDPRFLAVAGEFSAEKYQKNYGFLIETRRNELNTIKENLKRARRMLSSSPRNQRAEWENEVKRLEATVKRGESAVNKDKQEEIEREALRKVAKEERQKRKEGKQGWWMKNSEKKKVVMEARYKALETEGGRKAVKKAIEKKQKKIGQKEKRSRPRVGTSAREDGREGKRRKTGI